ncbi:hypothetical protein FC093_01920 [Ilyomonas limi]|uniref:T9SS type A sorting domain-containing protein n=1 Tax=Ilyomonas limi TaxID=2575867 RepID=A0A4U3L9K9_9BACT|nr:hypothetical protein [Ilyomonas limi]TKK71800.1 hypothetical protein FC093_01920 [Ilyomonas limi]
MKKLFIIAACIATTLCSFANPATGKKKMQQTMAPTLNATVVTTGTKVIVTAISELPDAIDVTMQDEQGNEVYEGKLVKGEYAQSAVFNLEQLGEGTYSIVLQTGNDKFEKKIAINTTKQLTVE